MKLPGESKTLKKPCAKPYTKPTSKKTREQLTKYVQPHAKPFFIGGLRRAAELGNRNLMLFYVRLLFSSDFEEMVFGEEVLMETLCSSAERGHYECVDFLLNGCSKYWDVQDLYYTLSCSLTKAAENAHMRTVECIASTGYINSQQFQEAYDAASSLCDDDDDSDYGPIVDYLKLRLEKKVGRMAMNENWIGLEEYMH
jgi:hypothetical protein